MAWKKTIATAPDESTAITGELARTVGNLPELLETFTFLENVVPPSVDCVKKTS